MKYIDDLNLEQFIKYNIIAKKRSNGIISDKEFKEELNKIIKEEKKMKDYLNMKSAIINYNIKRLDCQLPPKPNYPCSNYKTISKYNFDLYIKKDFDLYSKKLWNHYNNCDNCDFGVWKFYNKKEKK